MTYLKKIILFTLMAVNFIDQPSPEIKIEQGLLRGRISKNGKFYEYFGIPYAVTTEATRFQAPLPAPHWEGVFNAIDEHFVCAQKFEMNTILGQEDCLKLNVYASITASKVNQLPVMVFVHGGGYRIGSGNNFVYGADYFIRHNVILVTFNYRLNALGFICLGIKEAPGNAGLRDQIAALKWVKKNIAAFGGDPDNVTLFGESAGAGSISHLLLTPLANGLFRKAILQSGSALSFWNINRDPLNTASLLAKELGYSTNNPYELYDIFMNTSYKKLVYANVIKPKDEYFDSTLVHLPCVEKIIPGIKPIITDLPYNVLKSGKYNKMPMIIGFNNKEGLYFINRDGQSKLLQRNQGYLLPKDLEFRNNSEKEDADKNIRKFYYDNKWITEHMILKLSELYSDLYIKIPSLLESEIIANSSGYAVYNYIFTYSGNRNIVKYMSGYLGTPGAVHADDLFYMFDSKILFLPPSKMDQIIIDRVTWMWTNFAKTGNPTPIPSAEHPEKWEPSTALELKFLNIEETLSITSIPNIDAYYLWKSIYSRHRKKT